MPATPDGAIVHLAGQEIMIAVDCRTAQTGYYSKHAKGFKR
jgi:hypothetical protein